MLSLDRISRKGDLSSASRNSLTSEPVTTTELWYQHLQIIFTKLQLNAVTVVRQLES